MNEGSTFQRVLPLQDAWGHVNPILHLHMGSPNISHVSWGVSMLRDTDTLAWKAGAYV